MNTGDVMELLRIKFSAPAYALLEDVARSTGFANRRGDAVAMSLWPSRGFDLIGMEVKVSRSDWLRELKNPEKAEAIFQFMDYWYIVAGDATIVKPEELPKTWGLLLAQKTRIKMAKPAERLGAKAVDRSFLAAIMRKVHEHPGSLIEKARREGFEKGQEQRRAGESWCVDEHRKLQAQIDAFEKASGIDIDNWQYDAATVGAAVKLVLEHGDTLPRLIDRLRRFDQELAGARKHLNESIGKLNAIGEGHEQHQ